MNIVHLLADLAERLIPSYYFEFAVFVLLHRVGEPIGRIGDLGIAVPARAQLALRVRMGLVPNELRELAVYDVGVITALLLEQELHSECTTSVRLSVSASASASPPRTDKPQGLRRRPRQPPRRFQLKSCAVLKRVLTVMVLLSHRLSLDDGGRGNHALVDGLLGNILPIDELDGAVGALLGAATAGDALGRCAGLGVMWGMFHGQAAEHMPQPIHTSSSTNASAGFLVGVNGMDGAVLGALRIGALLAGGYRELAVAEDAVVGIDAGAEVVVVPHAHTRDGLLGGAGFSGCIIISQRWQPEQRARPVTIIFVGVVRSSMRPEAMERQWSRPRRRARRRPPGRQRCNRSWRARCDG